MKNQSTCKHTRTVGGEWVEDYVDDEGEQQYRYEHEWEQPTSVDVDLHHYKCTQCGLVKRY